MKNCDEAVTASSTGGAYVRKANDASATLSACYNGNTYDCRAPASRHAVGGQHLTPANETPQSPTSRRGSGLLQGLRQSSSCLSGIIRGSRPSSPASAAPPPSFEVRGASLLTESPRPATPKPSMPSFEGCAVKSPTINLQARAGYASMHRSSTGVAESYRPSSSRSPSGSPHWQLQHPAIAIDDVQSNQVDLAGCSPRHETNSPNPAAAGTASISSTSSSARSSISGAESGAPYITYHVPVSLAGQSNSVVPQVAALCSNHVTHQNPLYTPAESMAAHASPRAGHPQSASEQATGLLLERIAALNVSIKAPGSPKPSIALASGTPSANLQAMSNLTMVNDSRPVSPGPFLAAPDSNGSSRPVSPHFADQPPTPGSFATALPEAPAGLRPGSAQPAWPGSAPVSPTKAAALATAGPLPSAGFRTPIYNRDGKFVGWRQNSNLVRPLGMSMPSSNPSSPSKGVSFADHYVFSDSGDAVHTATASPLVTSTVESDFAQFLAEPHKGFPDAENQVQGYVLGPVLGKGGFCSVRKALHELTGQTVACKIIEKSRLKDPKDRDRVDRECRVMKNLSNHVSIIKMYEWVETPGYVYIMMEHCTKGSLLEHVRDRKKLAEEEAVVVLQQLLIALQFCHRKDVVHRDIKLENILVDEAGNMKLIDFGLCGYYVAGKRLRCHCGSPSYAAPEIVGRKDYLGPPVDVWSLGVVLFAMLAGYLPFHAKEKKQLSEKILSGVYKPASWMSAPAQDLLRRMLTLDPDQRITLETVWQHPWVGLSGTRWEPPGVGSGGAYRQLTDPATGSVIPDEIVMEQLAAAGMDVAAVRRSLRMRECSSLTAAYHLMHQARMEQVKQVAQLAASEANFQHGTDLARWSAGQPSSPRSPGRPKTAASPTTTSPTRFLQEVGGTAAPHEVRMLPRDLPMHSNTERHSLLPRPGTALPVYQATVSRPEHTQRQEPPFVIKAFGIREAEGSISPQHASRPASPGAVSSPKILWTNDAAGLEGGTAKHALRGVAPMQQQQEQTL